MYFIDYLLHISLTGIHEAKTTSDAGLFSGSLVALVDNDMIYFEWFILMTTERFNLKIYSYWWGVISIYRNDTMTNEFWSSIYL